MLHTMKKLVDLVFIKSFANSEGLQFRRLDNNKTVNADYIKILKTSPVNIILNHNSRVTMKSEDRQECNALLLAEKPSQHYSLYSAYYCRVKHMKENRESRIVNKVKEILQHYTHSNK